MQNVCAPGPVQKMQSSGICPAYGGADATWMQILDTHCSRAPSTPQIPDARHCRTQSLPQPVDARLNRAGRPTVKA